MKRPVFPKSKAMLLLSGVIATVVIATLAIAISGIVRDAGTSSGGPATISKAPDKISSPAAPATSRAGNEKRVVVPDPAAVQLRVKRVLKIDGPFKHGEYVWDDAGVPPGPVVITIDLKAQTLSVFRDGYEIGAAVILYGATDKPSPLGSFPILEKDADHFSNLYDNAPMPYALRLTQDGVFIHGSDVIWGNATHGCIGVPTEFAKKLFGVAKLGDPVIITDGKMLDVSGASVG